MPLGRPQSSDTLTLSKLLCWSLTLIWLTVPSHLHKRCSKFGFGWASSVGAHLPGELHHVVAALETCYQQQVTAPWYLGVREWLEIFPQVLMWGYPGQNDLVQIVPSEQKMFQRWNRVRGWYQLLMTHVGWWVDRAMYWPCFLAGRASFLSWQHNSVRHISDVNFFLYCTCNITWLASKGSVIPYPVLWN